MFENMNISPDETKVAKAHGYGTMCKYLETDYGLEIIRDLISDNFDCTVSLKGTNIWIHNMFIRAKETRGLKYFLLSNIIDTQIIPGTSCYYLEALDHFGKKDQYLVDPETIALIKHIHSLDLLKWSADPSSWLE